MDCICMHCVSGCPSTNRLQGIHKNPQRSKNSLSLRVDYPYSPKQKTMNTILLILFFLWRCRLVSSGECTLTFPYEIARHKPSYTVGVLAIRGFEAAYNEFNRTFADYLTATAGQRFDTPINFRIKPLNFLSLFSDVEAGLVDFIYVNPSAYSCIESEYTSRSLASQISRRRIQGNVYDLKKFGGVILARTENEDVNTIQDIKGKIVAAASISGLGSGQMQFLEMKNAGMSYINDPKQLVFTSNQGKVVNGVLSGEFDVGFVRTDQLERSKDSDGNLLNTSLFKIIDPKPNLTIDGVPFPFQASTPLYPEWNIAALHHVPEDVSQVVQDAMLALADHARAGQGVADCELQHNVTHCAKLPFPDSFSETAARCDTTRAVAEIAVDSMAKGKFAGWQTTLSYMQLRSMQEATGFIRKQPDTNIWHCVRSAEIYDAISCPANHVKMPKSDVEHGCTARNLECKEGYQCLCTPCEPVYECLHGVTINGKCRSNATVMSSILVPLFLIILLAIHLYNGYKRKKADSVWLVRSEELVFGEPPQVIGSGTFGYVLLAEFRGTQVAVKRVIPGSKIEASVKTRFSVDQADVETGNPGFKSMSPEMMKQVRRLGSISGLTATTRSHRQIKNDFINEMRCIAKLRHPQVTTVMGAVISRFDEPMLIMEYMQRGSLYEVLRDPSIGDELNPLSILKDVAQGLRFLHSAIPPIIHGDMKAKNVLIDSSFRAKVTDFGLSAKQKSAASGTPFWMAPELLLGVSGNSREADVYAFGILMYEVYTRSSPYSGEDHEEVMNAICDPVVDKRPPVPSNCPPNISKLMKECTLRVVAARPGADQIDLALRVEGGVKERTSRLETLNKELEEANRKIAAHSEMQLQHFAMMSHELRTPLNCVIGISSLLEETKLDPSQEESVEMIVSSGKHLRYIIDDVLDYSKLESGNAEVDIGASNLQEIVTESVRSMAASTVTKTRNITIRTTFDPFLCDTIDTDSRRLLQILYNLISNAVKYSKDNGVVNLSVTLSRSQEDLDAIDDEVSPLLNGCTVLRFVVRDEGKGIARKDFGAIFRPFTQTVGGLANLDGGTGLGLAITKQLVEALGGTISVDSELGKWSEFTVDFPLTSPPVDVENLSFRLKNTKVYLIGTGRVEYERRVLEALRCYNISCCHLSSPLDLNDKLLSEASISQNHLFLIPGKHFSEDLSDRLSAALQKTAFVTYGPNRGNDRAKWHYRSLIEMFPSVLLRELGDYVETLTTTDSGHELRTADSSVQDSQLETLRVLVAEDNVVNQKVLDRILQRLGVKEIEIVENGQLAVDMEAARPFDICLMDMQMPICGGLEACKRILTRPADRHPKPKIIFVSAHVSESFRASCFECGAVGYLAKPCDRKSLRDMLLEHAPTARPEKPPVLTTTTKTFETLKILIAEDNLVNQKVLNRMLKRLGIEDVTIVENGQLAVDKEASESFDFLLMDYQMPVMDGIEATKLIVAHHEKKPKSQLQLDHDDDDIPKHPKIIFVSAQTSESFQSLCLENGAVDFLGKPVKMDGLKAMLLKHLE